jgi:hypothetical protein
MVHGSIRTDKLRLGLWEIRDADEVANIELVKKASEVELNKLRNELGNLNAIYFMGCRKLIREKQKMDWRDRNPNTIGKKKNRINSKKNRKNECFSGKNRSVNEVLKNSYDITEAEMKKKSDRIEKKRKSDAGEYKKRKKNEIIRQEEIEKKSTKRKMRPNSRLIEDGDCSEEKDIEDSDKKKEESIRCSDQEGKKKKKRKRRNISTTGKSEIALKKKKRRRTATEDIRVFFGTEDSH